MTAPALPSRVSFVSRELRAFRSSRSDPFGTRRRHARRVLPGVPRLVERHRLAALGLEPLFPRWKRVRTKSAAGLDLVNPFEDDVAPLARGGPSLSVHTASPGLWGSVDEAASVGPGCPCVFSPGRVPDGDDVPGFPLSIDKNATVPSDLDLTWSASCSIQADDYSIHEGALATFYSHDSIVCSTGGSLSWTITPAAGQRYFLVVPLNADAEGSYGVDSAGAERAVSATTCRTTTLVETCP